MATFATRRQHRSQTRNNRSARRAGTRYARPLIERLEDRALLASFEGALTSLAVNHYDIPLSSGMVLDATVGATAPNVVFHEHGNSFANVWVTMSLPQTTEEAGVNLRMIPAPERLSHSIPGAEASVEFLGREPGSNTAASSYAASMQAHAMAIPPHPLPSPPFHLGAFRSYQAIGEVLVGFNLDATSTILATVALDMAISAEGASSISRIDLLGQVGFPSPPGSMSARQLIEVSPRQNLNVRGLSRAWAGAGGLESDIPSGSAELSVRWEVLQLEPRLGLLDPLGALVAVGSDALTYQAQIPGTYRLLVAEGDDANFDGRSDSGGDEVAGEYALNFTTSQLDIEPTALTWDAQNGGVDFTYMISGGDLPKAPRFKFYWAGSASVEEIPGVLVGETRASTTLYHVDLPPSFFSAPPPGATQLRVKADYDDQITESSETNNAKDLAYGPSAKLIDVKYDGDSDHVVIDRFFSGVDVLGQSFTLELSESLEALRPAVRIDVGNEITIAARNGLGTYLVDSYNRTGTLTGDTPVFVNVLKDGTELELPSSQVAVIDMEPLPEWINVQRFSSRFDPAVADYIFAGDLIEITIPALFSVPENIPFVGGKDLSSQFEAAASVTVVAGLNPGVAPGVSGTADVNLQVLGRTVIELQYAYPTPGPFQLTLNLDARTLEMSGGTASYDPGAIQLPTIPLLSGQQLLGGSFLSAKSALSLTAALAPSLQIKLDSHGRIEDGSYAEARLGGVVSGDLLDLAFGPAATRELARLLRHVNNVSPTGIIVTAISAFVPSVFQIHAAGAFSLGAKVDLFTMQIKRLDGAFSLDVSGTVFGILLPSFISDPFDIAETWPAEI